MAKAYCIFRKGTNKIIDVIPGNQLNEMQLNTTCDYKCFESAAEYNKSKLYFCDSIQEDSFKSLIGK